MASFKYTGTFKRDFKRLENDAAAMAQLDQAMRALDRLEPLPASFHDHKLVGSLTRCRECHLRPNLLLLYEIAGNIVILHRLGTHAELFRR